MQKIEHRNIKILEVVSNIFIRLYFTLNKNHNYKITFI